MDQPNTPELRLSGIDFPQGRDPLGMWTTTRSPKAYGVGREDDRVRWKVHLTALSRQARVVLRQQRDDVVRREDALDYIQERLHALNPVLEFQPYALPKGYDHHDVTLLAEVRALKDSSAAFAAPTDPSVREDSAVWGKCRELIRHFQRALTNLAFVETDIAGSQLGVTAVDWTGDFTTAWPVGASLMEMQTHMEAVRVALASRQATAHLILVVIAGALNLAVKAGIPGGQFLLLPAVYTYVRDILQELTTT